MGILAGVIKDIATIGASILFFDSIVGINQVTGFALSLAGILLYKVYKQNLKVFLDLGFLAGSYQILDGWLKGMNQKEPIPNYEMVKIGREDVVVESTGCNDKV